MVNHATPICGIPFVSQRHRAMVSVVAFAPGGGEAMAAIALFLGYDPVFVGTHHVARIIALVALLPLVITRIGPPAQSLPAP